MNTEVDWDNIHIDRAKPIVSFDVSKVEILPEAINWKFMQPLLKNDNVRKIRKFDFLEYRLKYIKANQSMKLCRRI